MFNKTKMTLALSAVNANDAAIAAKQQSVDANAARDAEMSKLYAAGVKPTDFATYWLNGKPSQGRNPDCTADRKTAEQIEEMFLTNHADYDEIMAFKAMDKEQREELTGKELKRLRNLQKRPNAKRLDFGKSFANWLAKQERAELKARAEAGDREAQQAIDDAADLKTY